MFRSTCSLSIGTAMCVLSRQEDKFSGDREIPFLIQESNGQSVEMEAFARNCDGEDGELV